jgi:nucleotide-binding universal stress UspA family protein
MKRILLATDGSPGARDALALLARLPGRREATLDLVHVVEHLPSFARNEEISPQERQTLETITRELEEDAGRIIGAATEGLVEAGWSVRTHVRSGDPAEEILACAAEVDAEVIAMGATGSRGAPHQHLGSTARRILREASTDILLARGAPRPRTGLRLLVGLDESDASRDAAATAASISDETTSVILMSVLTVTTTFYRYDIAERLSQSWRKHRDAIEEEVARTAENLRAHAATVDTRVVDGGTSASDELLEAARLIAPDIALVGRSGKGAIGQFVLGSVSSAMVDFCPSSVWVVGAAPREPERRPD